MRKFIPFFTLCVSISILNSTSQETDYIPDTYDLQDLQDLPEVDTMQIFFADYEKRADLYLSKETFEGTPLTGSILSTCARNTYDSTGIIIPLELALSQAQWESSMGRKGLSPKKNPFNVGEWDRGTMITFETTEEGVQAYYNLIANDYLMNRDVDDLLENFVNVNGHRYASSPDYETKISNQFNYIRRWIDKNENC
jgi:hypothetical protein